MIVCGVAGTALLGAALGYGEPGDGPAGDGPADNGEAGDRVSATSEASADSVVETPQATDAKRPRAKPRGRLPAYFGKVVDAEQRERIYDIQRSYAEQIEPLRQQLVQLDEQLRAEVREVLSDEQQQEIDELVDKARARREAAKAERETARKAADTSAAGQ